MTYEAEVDHYAHVVDGTVVNVSVWDGVQEYQPDSGVTLVKLLHADETNEETGETVRRYTGGIGWTYRDGVFVDERPVEEDEDL